MKKKKHPEHVNHERWLVSYADFITLLFAFFVVMFAVSQVDSRKVGRFTESFSKAIGIAVFPHNGHGVLPGLQAAIAQTETQGSNDTQPLPSELEELQSLLMAESARNVALANVQVVRRRNELVLRLPEGIVFASGDASVKESAMRTLLALAATLRPRRVDVRVEGHTDNRPIHTTRFRSNWDLSTARATSVLEHLIAEGQMPPERLSAAGYGEFHPVASNDTDANRQLNRRVDLVVSAQPPPTDAGESAEQPVDATGPAPADSHDATDAQAPATDTQALATDAQALATDASAEPAQHDAHEPAPAHEPAHEPASHDAHDPHSSAH